MTETTEATETKQQQTDAPDGKSTTADTSLAAAPAQTTALSAADPMAALRQLGESGLNPSLAIMLNPELSKALYRQANVYAGSTMVPEAYRGNVGNCFIVMQLAIRLNSDPWMVMQHSHVIHGRPGLDAKFIIALVNQSGKFLGPIQWRMEGTGDKRSCTAYATHRETGEVCEFTVDWAMVKAEGWASKSGSKWLTMPDAMFRYRSAAFFARMFCPEVIMGMPTIDELRDSYMDVEVEDEQHPSKSLADRIERASGDTGAKEQDAIPSERQRAKSLLDGAEQ